MKMKDEILNNNGCFDIVGKLNTSDLLLPEIYLNSTKNNEVQQTFPLHSISNKFTLRYNKREWLSVYLFLCAVKDQFRFGHADGRMITVPVFYCV